MEYYNLNTTQQSEIKNILDSHLHLLANELGNDLFTPYEEGCELHNFECDEEFGEYPQIMQWWIVSDFLAEKLINNGDVIMRAKGLNFWGRCGCGYALECDFVSIYKTMAPFNTTK